MCCNRSFFSRAAVCGVISSCLLLASCFLTQTRDTLPPDSEPFTGMIDIGSSREGTLQGGGRTYFTVEVSTMARVTVEADSLGSACDPILELQDSLGRILARDDNSGGRLNARLTVPLAPGRYAIILNNNAPSAGSCRLSVRQEAGAAGGQQQAVQLRPPVSQGRIAIGETREGNLGQGEQHAWALTITQPKQITVDLAKGAGSQLDTYLKLLDAQNNTIEENDDAGGSTDSRISRELQAGTYTIIALPYGASAGGYRLAVSEGIPQAAVVERKNVGKGELAIGKRTDGFMAPGENHVYSLKLAKKENLAIDANRVTQGTDPMLELLGPGGESIAKDDDGGGERNASIVRGLEKGDYRVIVSGYGNTGGAYRLYVNRVHIEPQKHTTIEPGAVREAYLGPTDQHRYTFTMKKQAMAEINLKSADGQLDPMLELKSADGRVIGQDDDGGGNRDSKIVQYLEPGEYALTAKSYQGSAGNYALSLAVTDIRPQEHTGISTGVTREGWVFPGKIHSYDFRAAKQALYQIDAVTGDGRFDPMLSLSDAQGQALGNDDDGGGGNNARIIKEMAPGSYRIGVMGYGGSSTGKYLLSVREIETRSIRDGESRGGTLEDGGTHVYAFDLREKGLVTIDGRRADASQMDPFLTLISSAKGVVARDDDGGGETNAKITGMLEAGRYYIALTSYTKTGGGYTVSLERKDVPPPVDAMITVGDRRQGAILYPGQRDRYTFTVASAVTLTLNALADNSRLDTFLELYDAQGVMLNSDDDGGGGTNSMIRMRFEAGTYSVVVRSYNNTTGAYVLAVQQ
ncbi:MAG: PPC domain-containing protein [Spirochaetes bacterium]|nr:PPC domain-containing protein [Spirochaetota bacterium]